MSSAAVKIMKKFNKMKTLPHVVTKLSKLIHDESSTMKDFEDVIKMDPTLVVRLLQLVNSPYYGLMQQVDSISRAVAFIGMKNLYNLAVTDALKNIFSSASPSSEIYSRERLWMHCAAVSITAKALAERIFGINGDDAYLCGILHDFGLIVEEQVAEADFLAACEAHQEDVPLVDVERQYLGTDHCEIGYLLTQEWDMPVELQEAVRDHHTQLDEVEPGSLTGILQISGYLAAQLNYNVVEGATVQLSANLVEHIQENMDEYTVLLEDLPEEMENAQDLYSSSQD